MYYWIMLVSSIKILYLYVSFLTYWRCFYFEWHDDDMFWELREKSFWKLGSKTCKRIQTVSPLDMMSFMQIKARELLLQFPLQAKKDKKMQNICLASSSSLMQHQSLDIHTGDANNVPEFFHSAMPAQMSQFPPNWTKKLDAALLVTAFSDFFQRTAPGYLAVMGAHLLRKESGFTFSFMNYWKTRNHNNHKICDNI